jgi:predicted RNase H-related nuclease YkuK (DUF458 family)
MNSLTYGKVDMKRIVEIVDKMVLDNPLDEFQIVIGTDSQNFDKTKIVAVIAVIEVGKGGIFFYDVTKIGRINNVKQKLMTETGLSLQYATELMEAFEDHFLETGFDFNKINFSIHVDAGPNGPTKEVIPEIVGWITACGWECHTKPEAFVASTIADRISK